MKIEFKQTAMLVHGYNQYVIIVDGVERGRMNLRFGSHYSPFRGWVTDDDPVECFTSWGQQYDPQFVYREGETAQ